MGMVNDELVKRRILDVASDYHAHYISSRAADFQLALQPQGSRDV